MTERSNPILRESVLRRAKRFAKKARLLAGQSRGTATPVFVMGYGRSGTTLLIETFEHDMRIDVLGENDPRIARDFMLVRERVGRVIDDSRAAVIVMKPILDSFAVAELMREHPTSRVIWLIRAFEPVVASALKRFGTTVADEMRELVLNDQRGGWIGKGIPATTLGKLRRLDCSQFSTNDWMALVWWSVNLTLLAPELVESKRFCLLKYEELVREPAYSMQRVYEFIDLPFRGRATVWIDSVQATKTAHVEMSDEVRSLCDNLLLSIDQRFAKSSGASARVAMNAMIEPELPRRRRD